MNYATHMIMNFWITFIFFQYAREIFCYHLSLGDGKYSEKHEILLFPLLTGKYGESELKSE